jgi:hypothetical protein
MREKEQLLLDNTTLNSEITEATGAKQFAGQKYDDLVKIHQAMETATNTALYKETAELAEMIRVVSLSANDQAARSLPQRLINAHGKILDMVDREKAYEKHISQLKEENIFQAYRVKKLVRKVNNLVTKKVVKDVVQFEKSGKRALSENTHGEIGQSVQSKLIELENIFGPAKNKQGIKTYERVLSAVGAAGGKHWKIAFEELEQIFLSNKKSIEEVSQLAGSPSNSNLLKLMTIQQKEKENLWRLYKEKSITIDRLHNKLFDTTLEACELKNRNHFLRTSIQKLGAY